MDDWTEGDLSELERTVTAAIEKSGEHDVTDVLAALGWEELVRKPFSRPALSVARAVFDVQGRLGCVSAALHMWTLAAFTQVAGMDPSAVPAAAVALPRRSSGGSAILLAGAPEGDVLTRSPGIAVWPPDSALTRNLPAMDVGLGLELVDLPQGEGKPVDTRCAEQAWGMLEALVRLGLAQETAGACRAALDLAVEHVRARKQFGKPLGAFQAVQHKLAEAHAWWVALDGLGRAAFVSTSEDELTRIAPALSRLAGQSCDVVAKATQQVHGAIGFTAEHPLHHHLQRIFTLDGLVNGTDWVGELDVSSSASLWSLLDVVRP